MCDNGPGVPAAQRKHIFERYTGCRSTSKPRDRDYRPRRDLSAAARRSLVLNQIKIA
jgi:hypothetical protein